MLASQSDLAHEGEKQALHCSPAEQGFCSIAHEVRVGAALQMKHLPRWGLQTLVDSVPACLVAERPILRGDQADDLSQALEWHQAVLSNHPNALGKILPEHLQPCFCHMSGTKTLVNS